MHNTTTKDTERPCTLLREAVKLMRRGREDQGVQLYLSAKDAIGGREPTAVEQTLIDGVRVRLARHLQVRLPHAPPF